MNRSPNQRQRRPLKVKARSYDWQPPLSGALLVVLVLLIILRTSGGA